MIHLKYRAELDPDFQPMEMVMRDYEARVRRESSQRLSVALVRNKNYCERFEMDILADGVDDDLTCAVMERFIKTLLWVYGGWKIVVCGSAAVYRYLHAAYQKGGLREFDVWFMSRVYERPFEVVWAESPSDVPRRITARARWAAICAAAASALTRRQRPQGQRRHRRRMRLFRGGRLASQDPVRPRIPPSGHPRSLPDRRVEAAPRGRHRREHRGRADRQPRHGRVADSSRSATRTSSAMVKNIYLDIAKELGEGIPIEVANDGDVTAPRGR